MKRAVPIRNGGNFVLRKVVAKIAAISIFGLVSGPQSHAQQKPDYSGHYILTLVTPRHSSKPIPTVHLTVTQYAETVEVVMAYEGGKSTTSRYALDGAETSNVTGGGAPTKDTIKFKGKRMVVTTRVSGKTPIESIEMIREWELSPDLHTLTIKVRVHVPMDWSMDTSSVEKYSRQR